MDKGYRIDARTGLLEFNFLKTRTKIGPPSPKRSESVLANDQYSENLEALSEARNIAISADLI